MARVPPIDLDRAPGLAGFADLVRGRRRGRVINVYRTLAHSPELARSWFAHINNVRWGTGIDDRLREIVIVRLARAAGSAYVLRQHVPGLAGAAGLAPEACEALADWRGSQLFDDRERVVLAYADAMAGGPDVPDSVFAPLRAHFSDRQIVELTVLVGAYLSHIRVLGALRVDLEPEG